VADPAVLDALERYCYTAGDVIDHHGYFDHGHAGEAASYSVRPGQTFSSQSALQLRQANPIPYVETEGYPHIVSEIGWPMPNMYRAEYTFLAAAYGILQGLDGVYSFAIGSAGWDQQVQKFPVCTPATLGCFPAAALIFRRGYLREAPTVVLDVLDVNKLYALQGTSVFVAPSYDQLRAPREKADSDRNALDPATFYTGRVARTFDAGKSPPVARDTSRLIDHQAQRIDSVTGELQLDYGRGLVTMNAPQAQGAAGFLGRAGEIQLQNVSVRMGNDYGTVTVVPLDDQPLEASRQILIQCMTMEQFYGFEATGDGDLSGTIKSVGSAPCGVQQLDVTLLLKLPVGPWRVVACDEHGYPKATDVELVEDEGRYRLELDPVTVYHVLQR
jgi:hypothetical protein